ncbi:MAG: DUF4132 domain-containing protein [Lachnospiraceae bacterium]|nr:DUF4132 domain-containing protein [Lachnospiraceae bacterium]
MMIDTDDKQTAEALALLEKLGISEQDCVLAERYLSGEVGDEVLDQFQRIDFSAAMVSYQVKHELNAIEWQMNQGGMFALWKRLFNILFAVGHSTSSVLFTHSCVNGERYKSMVIYIEICSEQTGYLNAHHMNCHDMGSLMREIDNKPQNLRKMIDQLRGEGVKYSLTVLAVYFERKYAEAAAIEAEDAAFMKEYEEGMLDALAQWLAKQGCAAQEEIVSAIRTNRLTKELLASVKQCSFTDSERRQLCFIGSMAYLNFTLSDVLRDIARTCLSVDAEWVLFALSDVTNPDKLTDSGNRDFSEILWIEPETYIRWVAFETTQKYYYYQFERLVQVPVLKGQLEKNQESYLRAMDENGYATLLAKKKYSLDDAIKAVNVLKDVLKEADPDLYEQVDAGKPDYERIIGHLVEDTPHAELAREYLRGNSNITELYPYEEEFSTDHIWRDYLKEQKRHWNDKAFLNRCKAFTVLIGWDKTTIVEKDEDDQRKHVELFFQMLSSENLDIAHQLNGFVASYTAYTGPKGCSAETLLEGAVDAFAGYLDSERRGETIAAFSGARAEGRYMVLLAMRRDTTQNKQEILNCATDTAKLVREELLDILYCQRNWEDEIKALLGAKKAAQREIAVQVLAHWQQEDKDQKYQEVLRQAMEKEKNAKVLALLQRALDIQESALPQKTLSREELVKQLHKGGKKKSLAWAYETSFSLVHRMDGAIADEAYLQAVLLCYVSQDKNGVSKDARMLADDLRAAELAVYMNELFDRWLAAGAESKKRWVLYAAAIHGGEDMIQKLQHQIQEWPQEARGAIAAEAVKALALNPSPRAMLIVDSFARKFKFKQVKAAAAEALEFAAAELGITREELSDRIVPDLGFDGNMERIFDYGERTFKVMLTPRLDIEVYDESGKKLKSLPTPGKKDDEGKAAAAYAEFKEMKKQMKAAVTSQKSRLEYALSVKREWSVDAWRALFVRNPLMHQFAIGLIWGIYENDRLIQSFRYMEDGSFNTQDEEEYTLPEQARISLVHPLELEDGEKAAWKEQLSDYDVIQPIEQLDREVYHMTEEEADKQGLERFGGCIINDLSLNGKMTGLGWYRGSVQDGGGFYSYYREDAEAGIGVELHFSGTYVGGLGDDVTLYDVRFYKAGTIARGSYVYDEADKEKAYYLKDVSPRYFSEIVLQIARATASSEEKNENWRKEASLI